MGYTVVVGNIGTVYQGDSLSEAREKFDAYAEQSRTNYGRASGEDVSLCDGCEVIDEHIGSLDGDDLSDMEEIATDDSRSYGRFFQ